ncbi:MAG: NADH-quinone oxidoreductase subunit NuoE [Candidatus Thermoplasmatota archaeon]|nr:NADH-quinone oxidoreductase subunit NuoE [Candidatus Thermoplasmatota archaeon]MDP7264277.1 NADH-quinone oxidoreductase subunit NuoE [Candidatus Thermoplasmatota archaeon]
MVNGSADEVDTFIRTLISYRSMDRTKTIEILQLVQHKYGYISRDIVSSISRHLRKPEIEIMGIATFYEQFRFNKPGDHTIKVCEGTACHVKGGAAIGQVLERELDVGHGETTKDGMFSLERVACLGCCALAPVLVMDENIHGQMDTSRLTKLLGKYKKGEVS